MLRNILIIILLLGLSGCYNAPDAVKPMSWLLKQMPDDAPNKYKVGWKDGCESGMSSMTNTMYKTFYSFKQDKNLRKDPTYYKAWKDTYTFCRHYVYGTLRQGDQRMNLQNSKSGFMTSFMGAEGVFSTGAFNLNGLGGNMLTPLGNIGPIGGNGSQTYGMGGVIDFSGEQLMNGIGGGGLNWDFGKDTPFFGGSTIDRQ